MEVGFYPTRAIQSGRHHLSVVQAHPEMKSVESLLDPFCGYLRLGMLEDAQESLETLPGELKSHPLVLEARLILLVELEKWEEGAKLGASLCNLNPLHMDFYFKTAYCLHELKRTIEAKQILIEAPPVIQAMALYYYNLACYETQLGNLDIARKLLTTCFEKDSQFRILAPKDTDLKALWDQMKKL